MTLNDWLNANNVRQWEFAQMIGQPPATISHWIVGRHKPGIEMIAKIEKATEGAVGMYDFLEGIEKPVFHKKDRNGKK